MKVHAAGFRAQLLALIMTSLLVSPLAAQTITLRRAVELALNRSREGGAADAGQDRSYGFPLSLENAAPSLFNVTSQQVLYSPAQKSFVRSANTSWVAAKWQSRDDRDTLIQDAVLTYVELNKWSQEIELLETELANNQKMEGIVQQRIQAGVDSPLELNKARLATARVRMRIAEAKGSADVMRIHLAQLTSSKRTIWQRRRWRQVPLSRPQSNRLWPNATTRRRKASLCCPLWTSPDSMPCCRTSTITTSICGTFSTTTRPAG
jgi:outer membrane protein TolC